MSPKSAPPRLKAALPAPPLGFSRPFLGFDVVFAARFLDLLFSR
jgi:hypothetical protein